MDYPPEVRAKIEVLHAAEARRCEAEEIERQKELAVGNRKHRRMLAKQYNVYRCEFVAVPVKEKS